MDRRQELQIMAAGLASSDITMQRLALERRNRHVTHPPSFVKLAEDEREKEAKTRVDRFTFHYHTYLEELIAADGQESVT